MLTYVRLIKETRENSSKERDKESNLKSEIELIQKEKDNTITLLYLALLGSNLLLIALIC